MTPREMHAEMYQIIDRLTLQLWFYLRVWRFMSQLFAAITKGPRQAAKAGRKVIPACTFGGLRC